MRGMIGWRPTGPTSTGWDDWEVSWLTPCTGRSLRICAQVESGELPPGSQLPTEIELREEYSRVAQHHPGRDQVADHPGLVETRPGQGTFVPRTVVPFITTLTGDPKSGYPEGDPYKPERRRSGGRASRTTPKR